MTPFQAYKTYLALKLHFSSDTYDYFKFNGKVAASLPSFEKRKDRYQFEKLARLPEPKLKNLLIPNFLHGNIKWPGDLFSVKANEIRCEWEGRIQKLHYQFKEDLDSIINCYESNNQTFDWLFEVPANEHPQLLTLTLQGEISLETFIILNLILGFFSRFDQKIEEEIIWPDLKRKCLKYLPFLDSINISDYKAVLKDKVL